MTTWKTLVGGVERELTSEQASEYAKQALLSEPVLEKAGDTKQNIEALKFTKVLGPDTFDAEFGVKGDDAILHFWSAGSTVMVKNGKAPFPFPKHFMEKLNDALKAEFYEGRYELELGSIPTERGHEWQSAYVRIPGLALAGPPRARLVQFLSDLHTALGGK